MTARQLLIQHFADLSEDEASALLPIVQHLRAKRLGPASAQVAETASPEIPPRRHHPERFGRLAGSVRRMGDVESPVADEAEWTSDAEHLKL